MPSISDFYRFRESYFRYFAAVDAVWLDAVPGLFKINVRHGNAAAWRTGNGGTVRHQRASLKNSFQEQGFNAIQTQNLFTGSRDFLLVGGHGKQTGRLRFLADAVI